MQEHEFVLYIIISISVSLFFALAVILFLNIAQKKITNSKLKEQDLKLSFQKEMLENTVRIKEQERNRISKELHDDVSSQLGIMNLNMHVLKKLVRDDPKINDLVDQIESAINSSSKRTRSISHDLMPIMFKKFGLHHAFEELTNAVNISKTIELEIIDDFLIKIEDNFKLLHIYRIVQELINNTLKYANATSIRILFKEDNDHIILSYIDDGIGFDMESVTSGLGISNINTRVTLLDGTVIFNTKPYEGFELTVKFPNYDKNKGSNS
jgi:signal transduction histidine kinase